LSFSRIEFLFVSVDIVTRQQCGGGSSNGGGGGGGKQLEEVVQLNRIDFFSPKEKEGEKWPRMLEKKCPNLE